jgi:hypothetical protein
MDVTSGENISQSVSDNGDLMNTLVADELTPRRGAVSVVTKSSIL